MQGGLFASLYGSVDELSYDLYLDYDANGECFEKEIDAQIMVALDASGNFVKAEFNKKTGYDLIDSWLLSFLTPPEPAFLPSYVFEDLQQDFSGAVDSGDIIDWLYSARNSDEPIIPPDETYGSYGFEIVITVENNNCMTQKKL